MTPKVIVQTPEPKASAALYVFEFVKALHESGVAVALFSPENFEYAAQLRTAGIEFLPAPARPVSKAGLLARLWRNAVWVAQTAAMQLRITKPGDIVHFQFLIHLPLGFIFLWLVRFRRAGIVFTAHDPLPHKWRLPASLRRLEKGMLAAAYRMCDAIIVHNQVGKTILIKEFQYPEQRIAIVPHGPLAAAPESAAYPRADVLRLLLFGSIRENKGVSLAIEAVQKLHGRVRLTIAGSVTAAHSEYWQHCQELIRRNPDSIDVMERYFEDDELPPLLARHHAVLMPYLDFFSESGVASLALSSERPIISTGAGGLAELLEESGGGILIQTATADGIKAAIESAFEVGFEQLRQQGVHGAAYLKASRSWKTIGEKTRQVYFSLRSPVVQSGQKVAA